MFQVAERALYYWNNEYIMSLIEENSNVVSSYNVHKSVPDLQRTLEPVSQTYTLLMY